MPSITHTNYSICKCTVMCSQKTGVIECDTDWRLFTEG